MVLSAKLLVGLGNPGSKYKQTRHNVGQRFIEMVGASVPVDFRFDKYLSGYFATYQVNSQEDCHLFLPECWMNESGAPVVAAVKRTGIMPEQLLIAHDELDLPVGAARLKAGGGSGGHNGLRNIGHYLGNDFKRLRIGIGHPGTPAKVVNYVLAEASQKEQRLQTLAMEKSLALLPTLLTHWHKGASLLNGYQANHEEHQDGI